MTERPIQQPQQSTCYKFNGGASPLVIAYIGKEEPNRGDSHAAEAMATYVARLMNGRFLRVDAQMLIDGFPTAKDMGERLAGFMKEQGTPDVVTGRRSYDIEVTLRLNPELAQHAVLRTSIENENISASIARTFPGELVPHHLDVDLLDEKAAEFTAQYPNIKGPLVAVMLGEDFDRLSDLAGNLRTIATHYDDISFFLCPKRNTSPTLVNALHEEIDNSSHACVFSVDYEKALKTYNPYLGLLGRADHIVVAGESYSLVSEALYTGKAIYGFELGRAYSDLTEAGYIRLLEEMTNGPFENEAVPRLNITGEIAEKLVNEYVELRCETEPDFSL